MRLILLFFVTGFLLGCGGQLQNLAYPPPEDSLTTLLMPSKSRDAEKLQATAYTHFRHGDYVRALQYAYRATQTTQKNIHHHFLLALIYDLGLNRPDLAFPEYQRVLYLKKDLSKHLFPRVHYLNHRSHQYLAEAALQLGMPPPLAKKPLAIFPFQEANLSQSNYFLSLGLMDLLLYDLQQISKQKKIDPLNLYILSHTYKRALPNARSDEYAKWVGANRMLGFNLIDLGRHQVRITIQIFDQNGYKIYEAPSFTGDFRELQRLRRDILNNSINGLDLSLPAVLPPIPVSSPITLQLYAKGLQNYATGQISKANDLLTQAKKLEPKSPLISRTQWWATLYLEGERKPKNQADIYMKLLNQPNPSESIWSRLQSTHTMLIPLSGAQTGTESPQPYKPPHTKDSP